MIQDGPGVEEYSQHCQVFGILTNVFFCLYFLNIYFIILYILYIDILSPIMFK